MPARPARRRPVRPRAARRSSSARCRCPRSANTTCCCEVGAVSVCGSDVHQFHATHSWAVNVPVVLGHEFCGTVAKAGRAVRGVKEGDRVVSETAAVICGTCMMCRTGPLQPVPDPQGLRLRRQRRDGVLREDAGALPARHPRHAAVRARVPVRAARRGLPVDVRQLDDPARRPGRGVRSRPDRAALRADGGACRRQPAGRRRPERTTRRGSRRRARSARPTPWTSRRGRSTRWSAAWIRSAPIWCATRRARAGRSTRRCGS